MAIVIGQTQWRSNIKAAESPNGTCIAGGNKICTAGGVAWIVAPAASEVSRVHSPFASAVCNSAILTAEALVPCGDWFIPNTSQLYNPGFVCRTYWDTYSCAFYWPCNYGNLYHTSGMSMVSGGFGYNNKGSIFCVRAFRCVAY